MKKFEAIQKKLGKNDNQMSIAMKQRNSTMWTSFRDGGGRGYKNLIKLWRLSGESAEKFFGDLEREILESNQQD